VHPLRLLQKLKHCVLRKAGFAVIGQGQLFEDDEQVVSVAQLLVKEGKLVKVECAVGVLFLVACVSNPSLLPTKYIGQDVVDLLLVHVDVEVLEHGRELVQVEQVVVVAVASGEGLLEDVLRLVFVVVLVRRLHQLEDGGDPDLALLCSSRGGGGGGGWGVST